MSDYRLDYKPLPPPVGNAVLGALIPWDSETFGFPVAQLRLGAGAPPALPAPALRHGLDRWARTDQVRLIAAVIPAADTFALSWLQQAGFRMIDCFVTMILSGLQRAKLPNPPLPLREATDADLPILEAMAARAFGTGRYHADPDFPRPLADRRYAAWVRNAFTQPAPGTHIFVADDGAGQPAGFAITVLSEGGVANAHFTCVAPEHQGSVVGYSLTSGQSRLLRDLGAKKIHARLSAANLPILNVNIRVGFHVLDSEFVLHWHSGADRASGTPGLPSHAEITPDLN